jgi:hypothetical protein
LILAGSAKRRVLLGKDGLALSRKMPEVRGRGSVFIYLPEICNAFWKNEITKLESFGGN